MVRVTVTEVARMLEQLRDQMAELSQRIQALEGQTTAAPVPAAASAAPPAGITEEELVAISAAIGAYLGVRAHIRQIRLVSTNAWAQQGRVAVQASHRLQG